MPLYIATRPTTTRGDHLNGEVHKYGNDGQLELKVGGASYPAANTGGGAYDPGRNLIWVTNFTEDLSSEPLDPLSKVSAFSTETLEHDSFFELTKWSAELVLLSAQDELFVGYQQRTFGFPDQEDWKSVDRYLPNGEFQDEVGLAPFGHQHGDWFDYFEGVVIYTDEKRLIRLLNTKTGDESVFADAYGTAPEGMVYHNESNEPQTYEQEEGGLDLFGIQATDERVYVAGRGFVWGEFSTLRTWISVWDREGNHLDNWLLPVGTESWDWGLYWLALSEDERFIWALVPEWGTFSQPGFGVFRVDAQTGEGRTAPLFHFNPDNEQTPGCLVTERVYDFVVPQFIRGRPGAKRLNFAR